MLSGVVVDKLFDLWRMDLMVGWNAMEKNAADSAQPCVVPTFVVFVCMLSSSSVHSVVVGRPYHVDVSLASVGQRWFVAWMIVLRGMLVKASVKS